MKNPTLIHLRPIARACGATLMILGFGSCSAGLAITLAGPYIPDDVEVPLGVVSGFTVDGEGRVYCAVQFYGRLQQYDAEGEFLGSTFIPAAAGAFHVTWNAETDRIVVATVRNRMRLVLDGGLEVISQRSDSALFFELDDAARGAIQRNGLVYEFRDFFLLHPRIIVLGPDGSLRTLVQSTAVRWLLMAPLPALLYIAIGLLLRFRLAM